MVKTSFIKKLARSLKYIVLPVIVLMVPLIFSFADSGGLDCNASSAAYKAALDVADPRLFGCIITRIINIVLLAVGMLFVIFVIFGAWKAAMALGDPKGLAAARDTWSNAIIGLVIVIVFFAIFISITGLLGITRFPTFQSIIDGLVQSILNLFENICVTIPGHPVYNCGIS